MHGGKGGSQASLKVYVFHFEDGAEAAQTWVRTVENKHPKKKKKDGNWHIHKMLHVTWESKQIWSPNQELWSYCYFKQILIEH